MALIFAAKQTYPLSAHQEYRLLDQQNEADNMRASAHYKVSEALYELVTDPVFEGEARAVLDQRYCSQLRALKNLDQQIKRRSLRLDELHEYLSHEQLREIHEPSFVG